MKKKDCLVKLEKYKGEQKGQCFIGIQVFLGQGVGCKRFNKFLGNLLLCIFIQVLGVIVFCLVLIKGYMEILGVVNR